MLRPVVAATKTVGGRAATLTTMGGHPLTHPLGETFYTQVPLRHGDHVAKLSLAPVSPALAALKGAPHDPRGRPNGLRAAVIDFFREKGAEWELRVQLRTNPKTMPIEDASAEWPEEESPYLAVARVAVPPQPAWRRRAPGRWTMASPCRRSPARPTASCSGATATPAVGRRSGLRIELPCAGAWAGRPGARRRPETVAGQHRGPCRARAPARAIRGDHRHRRRPAPFVPSASTSC